MQLISSNAGDFLAAVTRPIQSYRKQLCNILQRKPDIPSCFHKFCPIDIGSAVQPIAGLTALTGLDELALFMKPNCVCRQTDSPCQLSDFQHLANTFNYRSSSISLETTLRSTFRSPLIGDFQLHSEDPLAFRVRSIQPPISTTCWGHTACSIG